MGHIEVTKLLLEHGFSANVEDINGETALDQIIYGKKEQYHNKESMQVYNLTFNAMKNEELATKTNVNYNVFNDSPNASDKYYIYIGGLTENMLENELIDLCELYRIYPNEIILNRGHCIIGVNDIDIVSKIYFMDESFFRCSILNVNIFNGNFYDSENNIQS